MPFRIRLLVNRLHLQRSLIVDSSIPTIYYGARTHKQIQQVIKEFKRTAYCELASMSILSSRDYSCIREFDRKVFASKNDMCRECCTTKVLSIRNKAYWLTITLVPPPPYSHSYLKWTSRVDKLLTSPSNGSFFRWPRVPPSVGLVLARSASDNWYRRQIYLYLF